MGHPAPNDLHRPDKPLQSTPMREPVLSSSPQFSHGWIRSGVGRVPTRPPPPKITWRRRPPYGRLEVPTDFRHSVYKWPSAQDLAVQHGLPYRVEEPKDLNTGVDL